MRDSLRSVDQESGRLLAEEKRVDAKGIMDVLEATLIEAMEPAGNRRQGENFKGIEYYQFTDPQIENERLMKGPGQARDGLNGRGRSKGHSNKRSSSPEAGPPRRTNGDLQGYDRIRRI